MKVVALKKNGRTVIESCRIATSFVSRFLGLMGKSQLSKNEAICFPKCNSIHTFFMRIPIDVLFVSASGKVVEVCEALAPWKLVLPKRGVVHTVEMSAARAKELGIVPGDQLECEGVWT